MKGKMPLSHRPWMDEIVLHIHDQQHCLADVWSQPFLHMRLLSDVVQTDEFVKLHGALDRMEQDERLH